MTIVIDEEIKNLLNIDYVNYVRSLNLSTEYNRKKALEEFKFIDNNKKSMIDVIGVNQSIRLLISKLTDIELLLKSKSTASIYNKRIKEYQKISKLISKLIEIKK